MAMTVMDQVPLQTGHKTLLPPKTKSNPSLKSATVWPKAVLGGR
jgi:hypothetical protein